MMASIPYCIYPYNKRPVVKVTSASIFSWQKAVQYRSAIHKNHRSNIQSKGANIITVKIVPSRKKRSVP